MEKINCENESTLKKYIDNIGMKAKDASRILASTDSLTKNMALSKMADSLEKNLEYIIEENLKDVNNGIENGMSKAMVDRLLLNESRIKDMANGLRNLADAEDPLGEMKEMWTRPNGIQIGKISVPLGVIGIIYEARPNVTVDAAGLCIKSGNVVVLKGGKEAINSNIALAKVICDAGEASGLPKNCIQLINSTEREATNLIMKLNKYIDVLIPRGGANLINAVVNNSTIPVIETGVGNCHIFVDESADFNMAIKIIVNAKTQRPGVCNAAETILIHKNIAIKFLTLLNEIMKENKVELRGCKQTLKILPEIKLATEEDFMIEFLDLILAIKVVDSIEDAINHIYRYGTKHSEAIITNDYSNSRKFLREVDAAAVYVNASTRFTDGSEFGFGAEIGISTQKLHARGPMGLKELTTSKYIIYGEGQIRE